MFGTLGGPELFLILVVALIVFGPRKLPEMGRSLGRMMAEFRKASNDFQRTIEDEVDADRARSVPPPRPASPEPPKAAEGTQGDPAAAAAAATEPAAAPSDSVSRQPNE
ncbi:MAG TPA: twin-arginine translocase TatA/TatE family subunit [Vicinamibacteria bacterium]|nr:twin-arginine translocase TatA/TatE family subunit [Vicinamibacteria bacterium]